MAAKHHQRILYPVLSILFPCLLGMVAMIGEQVSWVIFIQNAAVILLAAAVCCFVSRFDVKCNDKIMVFSSILFLGLTFAGPNLQGVHRWVRIPLFTVYMAAMVMPITIVALYRLIEKKELVISFAGMAAIALLLYLQPDAAQLSAFSLSVAVMLLSSRIRKITAAGFSAILFLLTFKSWMKLDALEPVNYTEGVLALLHDTSPILYILGIASLLLMPVCFVKLCRAESRKICAGIAAYYWMMILASFTGHFPVPFMGYGLSPIWGFYLFLIWFVKDSDRHDQGAPF